MSDYQKYLVSVEEVKTFHEDGVLIVRDLVKPDEIQELLGHTVDIMEGKIVIPGQIERPDNNATGLRGPSGRGGEEEGGGEGARSG